MGVLSIIVIAGISVYLCLKFCLYLYRPFWLSKAFAEIEKIHNGLLADVDKDIGSAEENLKAWRSGDKVVRDFSSEDDLLKRINDTTAAKAHEKEVHEKFLRLRERFISDPKKLSESIVTYRRYLELKLHQCQGAESSTRALEVGAISFDEWMAEARETMIALEESERKLDALLS